MIIKKYDMFFLKRDESSFVNIGSITKPMDNIIYIRAFLIDSLRNVSDFIKTIETYSKGGIMFELSEIHIDNQNNLVYITEGYHTYTLKPIPSEIEKLLEEGSFIQLCKMGFLDYIAMTKDNFMHLLSTWDKILSQLPPFALLYLGDNNWYDMRPFESQEAMEQFVTDHTKPESTQK